MKKQVIERLDASQLSQESVMAVMLGLSSQGVSYVEKWAASVVTTQRSSSSGVPVAVMTRQRAGQLSEICSGLTGGADLDSFLVQLADTLRTAELRLDKTSTRLFAVALSNDSVIVTWRDS